MRAISYIMLGAVGAMAFQRMRNNQPIISKDMRRMMRQKYRLARKIGEIF